MRDSINANAFISGKVQGSYVPDGTRLLGGHLASIMPPVSCEAAVTERMTDRPFPVLGRDGLQHTWHPVTEWQKNAALYDAAVIVANLLRNTDDGNSYFVGGMYIEFDNSGVDVDPVPTIARSGNLSVYYNNLNSSSPTRDYLRVPLTATSGTSSGTDYDGNNIATFLAQTSGTTGVHGLTYSDAANSQVYGGALVAFLDAGDSSQDLVLSRFYFDPANQIPKIAGSQVGLTWPVTIS